MTTLKRSFKSFMYKQVSVWESPEKEESINNQMVFFNNHVITISAGKTRKMWFLQFL